MNKIYLATPLNKNSNMHAGTAAFCSYTSQLPEVVQWGYTNTLSHEMSRNTLIEDYVYAKGEWTHIFYLDSDIVPPIDTMRRLLNLNADLAVTFCPLFMDGFYWSVRDKDNEWIPMGKELPKEPFETPLSGSGCFLARKEVVEAVGWPYFKMEYQPKYENNGQPIKRDEGEFFFENAKDKGYKIIADPSIQCEHYNQVGLLKAFRSSHGTQ